MVALLAMRLDATPIGGSHGRMNGCSRRLTRRLASCRPAIAGLLLAAGASESLGLDLSKAVIVSKPASAGPETKALEMLIDEVEKRTRVRWLETGAWPSAHRPVIGVGTASAIEEIAGPFATELSAERRPVGPEGYRLCVKRGAGNEAVFVLGDDPRGVLFGVGRLLRELDLDAAGVRVDDALDIASAPKYRLRGHQLGYRPKTNSYDAWDLPVWEQYLRDLVIFGCNAIELIPPRSDDDAR